MQSGEKDARHMDAELRAEIENLKKATRRPPVRQDLQMPNPPIRELKEVYRELFGEPSPSSNHAHLWRRIAWRMQARRYGCLSEPTRQRALELADDADMRLRAPGGRFGGI